MTLQQRLEQELERLKKKWGTAKELRVVFVPSGYKGEKQKGMTLHGEVLDQTIYIYIDQPELAIHTLIHEFFEYVVYAPIALSLSDLFNSVQRGYSKAFDEIANAYNEAFSKTHYRNKERIIELFAKVEYDEMKKREKKK